MVNLANFCGAVGLDFFRQPQFVGISDEIVPLLSSLPSWVNFVVSVKPHNIECAANKKAMNSTMLYL